MLLIAVGSSHIGDSNHSAQMLFTLHWSLKLHEGKEGGRERRGWFKFTKLSMFMDLFMFLEAGVSLNDACP